MTVFPISMVLLFGYLVSPKSFDYGKIFHQYIQLLLQIFVFQMSIFFFSFDFAASTLGWSHLTSCNCLGGFNSIVGGRSVVWGQIMKDLAVIKC